MPFTYISLFSGVGGGDLAAQRIFKWHPLAYVEWDTYCQEVLHARQQDGWLKTAPVFGDVREFVSDGFANELQDMVDVVVAGFPCQPFSRAGKGAGKKDSRNMWPATYDTICRIRPRRVLLENVAALLSSGYWQEILKDLASGGYDAQWTCVRAFEACAPHKSRDRLFAWCRLSDTNSLRQLQQEGSQRDEWRWFGDYSKVDGANWWRHDPSTVEPRVGRVADGVADRMDRLRACGNGIIPHQLTLAVSKILDAPDAEEL